MKWKTQTNGMYSYICSISSSIHTVNAFTNEWLRLVGLVDWLLASYKWSETYRNPQTNELFYFNFFFLQFESNENGNGIHATFVQILVTRCCGCECDLYTFLRFMLFNSIFFFFVHSLLYFIHTRTSNTHLVSFCWIWMIFFLSSNQSQN